ncbi:hypothetical protein J6590_015001 [Homalodisca vitripennis]|nr:hypothetical protein J6590_015001 [Homalodisca vitripennis]
MDTSNLRIMTLSTLVKFDRDENVMSWPSWSDKQVCTISSDITSVSMSVKKFSM